MPIETRANTNFKILSADIIQTATRYVSKEYALASAPNLPAYLLDTGLWGWGFIETSGAFEGGARSSPVQNIMGGSNWKSIHSEGVDSVVAINKAGQLWLWGNNTNGKLGDNTVVGKSSPVQTIAGGNNWKQAATSYANSIGVKADGTLWVWGNNTNGTIGDNTTTHRSSPVQTVAGGTNWKQASTGNLFSGAIKTDGSLWLWGLNTNGKLGDNTTSNRSSPVQTVAQGNNWRQLSCGDSHAAAIKDDGTLWLWGDNTYGQLGDGTKTHRSSPVQTISGGNNWKQVSSGIYHTAAIKTDGTLWCWGQANFGQLGNNSGDHRSSPVQTVATGTNWLSVSAGFIHTTAIKTDGSAWAWGDNGDGQLGDNTQSARFSPVQVIEKSNWVRITPAIYGTVGIKDDSQLDDTFFSINNVDTDSLFVRKQTVDEGHVWGWGQNTTGALGDNSTTNRSSPVQLVSTTRGWKDLAISKKQGTVVGIKDGFLYSWGDGTNGILGNSTTTGRSSPVAITGSRRWKRVSVGGSFAAAIEDNGTLWSWGDNTFGQLGTNNTTNTSSPVQSISTDVNWKQVSAGNNFVAAIKTDNSLWVWGQGTHGQLGKNSTTSYSSPVQTVSTDKSWKKVSAGGDQVAAIKTDDSLWLWGENNSGQLGTNDTTRRSSPTQILTGGTWRVVSSGSKHVAAIKQDGSLWVWGDNTYGQLGDNTSTHRSSPVQTISEGVDWKSVAAGNVMTAAIKTDDTLWVWGSNEFGQLGDGTTTHRSSPVNIVANTATWKSVAAGSQGMIALRESTTSGTFVSPVMLEMIISESSLTEIQIPGNFNPSNNYIEVLGAGADGGDTGGGGAAFVRANNVPLVAGSVANIRIATVGVANSYIGNTTHIFAAAESASGQYGGLAANSVGDIKYSGGDGNHGGGAAGSIDGNGISGNTAMGGSAVGINQGIGGLAGTTGSAGAAAPSCPSSSTTMINMVNSGVTGGTGSIGGTGQNGTAGENLSGAGGGRGGDGGPGGAGRCCCYAQLNTTLGTCGNPSYPRQYCFPAGSQGPGGPGGNASNYGAGGGRRGIGSSYGTQGLGSQGVIRIRWQPTF